MIAACLKWVDRRPEVDPLDAHVRTDARTAGLSMADEAALEWALRQGERTNRTVLAVSAGPPEAETVLRHALAAGVSRAVLVPLSGLAPSELVASALATVLRSAGVTTVWCGDHSLDRGSGSVPAYLAAELGLAQALGLVAVDLPGDGRADGGSDGRADGPPGGLRRLDRGRRERVALPAGGGVLSVEGATAALRRAPLPAALAARTAPIEVAPAADVPEGSAPAGGPSPTLRPYRPRARVLPAPIGPDALERIVALMDAGTAKGHGETVTLDPAAAAARILEALAAWGYDRPPG